MSNFKNDLVVNQINNEYQIYILFVVVLISLQLICNTIEPIIIRYGIFKIPASAIFYVLSFAIADILTENFGFQLAVRATVLNVISQFIYCGIATIVYLYPLNTQSFYTQESYQYIFHFLSLQLLSSIFSLLIAMIANDYLINKLKLLFLGKGFWWRTIVSTIFGEIIMLNIDYNITFWGDKSRIEIQQLIIIAMFYKTFAAFILSFPSAFISNYISKKVYYLKPSMNQKTFLLTDLKNAIIFK